VAEETQQQQPGEETVHHRSARQKRKAGIKPARMQLNLTSMIDVIFQLLIYFVVTATFAADEGVLSAELPRVGGASSENPEPPEQKLNIQLSPGPQTGVNIRLAKPRVDSFPQLAQRLVELQADPARGREGPFPPDAPVVIRPQGEVRWQHVTRAFNAAIKARYTNISFAAAKQ